MAKAKAAKAGARPFPNEGTQEFTGRASGSFKPGTKRAKGNPFRQIPKAVGKAG